MFFRYRFIFWLVFSFLLTACGTTPVFIDIHPVVNQQAFFNGDRTPVNLIIYDMRDTDALGYHGFDNKGRGYFAKQNLQAAVSSAMYRILNKNNFALSGMMTRSLTINILAIQFGAVDNLTSTDVSAETALEVIAVQNGKVFRKIYHGDIESTLFFHVPSDEIQNDINGSLSEALNNIARDRSLWLFLTER